MMTRLDKLSLSVLVWSAGLLGVLTVVGALIGGAPVALGIAGGGLIAGGNFFWLSLALRRLSSLQHGNSGRLGPWIGLMLRHVALFAALALTVSTQWVHPLGLLAGCSVLPPALIANGLLAGRETV